MSRRTWFVVGLAVVLVSWPFVVSQEGGFDSKKKDKKEKGANEEDARMAKLLEKVAKKPETERDRIIKELTKLAPGQLGNDYRQWYAVLAGSEPAWNRASIAKKGLGELFDRMAERLGISSASIPREDFLRYAEQYWREDNSPLWKAPKEWDANASADKLFKHLDRDRDGVLSTAELPDSLRRDLSRWDKNGDGKIDPDEYRAYFPHRLERVSQEVQESNLRQSAALEMHPPENESHPFVMRAGKLPVGLPAWYEQLDEDHDGQVALYEWRRGGWSLDEFERLDLNDDGFLVPDEVLKLLAMVHRDGSRPYAYLLQEQGASKMTPVPSGKKLKKR